MVAVEGIDQGRPWRLARPLVRILWEIDQRWIDRDRRSDGSIGNAAHHKGVTDLDHDGDVDQHDAALHSQHLPDTDGWVHALDVDSDGIDPAVVIERFKDHPAAWYVIWQREIISRTHGWVPQPYHGSDPHTGHLHLSTLLTTTGDTSALPWGIYPIPRVPVTPLRLTTTRRTNMICYAVDISPTQDKGPKDGQPDENVYRPGRLIPSTGRTQLVQLPGGPATQNGSWADYAAAGATVAHVSADHLRSCGYVLPGDPGYDD